MQCGSAKSSRHSRSASESGWDCGPWDWFFIMKPAWSPIPKTGSSSPPARASPGRRWCWASTTDLCSPVSSCWPASHSASCSNRPRTTCRRTKRPAVRSKPSTWRSEASSGRRLWRLQPGMEQCIDFAHHGEGVGDVEYVGLALSPSAIRIQVDRPPLGYERPADGVRLLAVATGGQSLGMPGGGAGLADLIHVGHETQNGLSLAGQVHERLRAPERGLGAAQKIENKFLGFPAVRVAVGLRLRPSGAGHEQQFRVGADRLQVGGRGANADDGCPRGGRRGNVDWLDRGGPREPGPWLGAARIEQDEPRTDPAADDGLEALAIIPAGHRGGAVRSGDCGCMRVDPAPETVRGAGEGPVPAGGGGSNDEGRPRGAADGGCGFNVRAVAGLGKRSAGNAEKTSGSAACDPVRRNG